MSKTLNLAVIGYGFMGKAHSNAYRQVNHFFETEHKFNPKVICGRNAENAQKFADTWGYEEIETDWKAVIARDDIDAIDICTPNDSHMEIAIAAAEAGKMILCEKPIARTGEEGEAMLAAVEKAGVTNLVWYNYRFLPAVSHAKSIVDSGELGKIFHYRANFLQDWTIGADLPQGGAALWRLDVKAAGSGVTGDLLAHCIDTARWINGEILSVTAMTETFIKERMHQETGKVEPVGIDDACAFMARFANGSLAIFESTRYARGHKALKTFEINGEHKSLAWDLHDLNRLSYFDHNVEGDKRGWSSIHVTDGDQPYVGNWWVPGLCLGYEHSFVHGVYEFLRSLDDPSSAKRYPDFKDALGTQYVCDAVLDSAKDGTWKDVQQV
ncbi:MAG: Gfo/Idh/MocA family protein [Roseibacillus sp.]|jgi:predicted dehydrogenase